MTTAELERTSELCATDRCDATDCSAAAKVRAHFKTGTLDFCGHHANPIMDALTEQAVHITDDREA